MGEIFNVPDTGYAYEFMVAKKYEDGNYEWIANYEDAAPAYDFANLIGGIVIHNVRVTYKEKI